MDQSTFLSRLQTEAKLQSKLYAQHWLPTSWGPLTNFIAKYAWQTCLVLAIITSLTMYSLE